MKKVPKLRFKEFNNELKNVYFFELGDIKIGLTHTPTYVKQGRIFLSSKNISKGYIDFEDVQYITEEEFKIMPESVKPKKGDILFTRVGSNLGNPTILEEEKKIAIFVSLGIFRVNNKANCYFIKNWMDSNYFWNQVEKKVAGGTKNNLNTTWLKEFKINIPYLQEQEKIANFLSSVDKKISLTEEKLELFKNYKKGIMQKIFSQKLRFKDENGNDYPEWEEKKIGEVTICLDNKRKPLNSVEREKIKGNIPYYGANGIQGYINDYLFDEELVLLAEDGGNFEEYKIKPIAQFIRGKSWINNHAHILKGRERLITKFLFYSLVHKDIRNFINGTSRSKLNKNNMLNIIIKLSSLEEQEKISNFLSSIDEKIEKIENELENLKEFKKGLLQQMFI